MWQGSIEDQNWTFFCDDQVLNFHTIDKTGKKTTLLKLFSPRCNFIYDRILKLPTFDVLTAFILLQYATIDQAKSLIETATC